MRLFALAALPLLLLAVPAHATTDAPGACPPGGCTGEAPPPKPKPKPGLITRHIEETHRNVKVASSGHVYAQVYETLFANDRKVATISTFSTYSGRLAGIRAVANNASATCTWDGHYGLANPAVVETHAWRDKTLVTNTSNLAASDKPTFAANCLQAVNDALLAGGAHQDDLDYFAKTLAEKYPNRGAYVPPRVHFFTGQNIVAAEDDSATTERKNRAKAVIAAVVGGFGTYLACVLGGSPVGATTIAAGSIVGGAVIGLGAYATFTIDSSHVSNKDLPEGGVDGVRDAGGGKDGAAIERGDGGAGSGSDDIQEYFEIDKTDAGGHTMNDPDQALDIFSDTDVNDMSTIDNVNPWYDPGQAVELPGCTEPPNKNAAMCQGVIYLH